MKLIPLTRGLFAKIDDADFEALSIYKWHANEAPNGKFYAARKAKVAESGRTIIYMHKVIVPVTAGVVDHWNGDSLDNQRENLRNTTQAINIANQLGATGVFYCGITGKWAARVSFDGKRRFLGRFPSKQEAMNAATAERIRLGIARTNPVDRAAEILDFPNKIGAKS